MERVRVSRKGAINQIRAPMCFYEPSKYLKSLYIKTFINYNWDDIMKYYIEEQKNIYANIN